RRRKRQTVNYPTREAAGTIIIDTPNTYLYYVLGGGQAIRYGIGVGREGFTWSGTQTIAKKAEWPDWTPPPEMIARQPYLPRHMTGGPANLQNGAPAAPFCFVWPPGGRIGLTGAPSPRPVDSPVDSVRGDDAVQDGSQNDPDRDRGGRGFVFCQPESDGLAVAARRWRAG